MDKSLRRTGIMNSALLALMFAANTAASAATGSIFGVVLGALVTYMSINDAFKFYNAQVTETKQGEQ